MFKKNVKQLSALENLRVLNSPMQKVLKGGTGEEEVKKDKDKKGGGIFGGGSTGGGGAGGSW